MEDKIIRMEKDIDKLWNEHRHYSEATSNLTTEVKSINDKLYSMSKDEIIKATERQKILSTLDKVDEGVEVLNTRFSEHIIDEMKDYEKMRKVIAIIGIVLISLVIDNEAGTHIVSSFWHKAVEIMAGI